MHKDKFFSSFTDIKKEDWDRIFGTPGLATWYDQKGSTDDPNYYEPQCLTPESS